MGDRPRAGRANISAARAEAERPHRDPVHGRRLQAGDLSASRAPIRASSTRCGPRCASVPQALADERGQRASRIPRPVDQRQLPLGTGGARLRRRGDRRGRASTPWACPSVPRGTSRIIRGAPGMVELWKPFTIDDGEDGEEGEEGWLDEDARRYADTHRRAGARDGSTRRRCSTSTKRPLTRRRHPDPGAQPRRARLADRRAAVCGAACRSPASTGCSSVEAARGARPARRGCLRGAAARRPQPRQSAGVAADRLGPGAAVRPRLRARQDPLWRALRERAGERDDSRPRTQVARRLAGDGRFHDAVALPRDDPVGPARRPPQALLAGSGSRRATRSTSCCPRALEFERDEIAVARPLPRLVRARRCRDPARPVRARQCGAGDDRPRRQGPGGAVRDPRRRDRRPGQARPPQSAARLARSAAQKCR